MNEFLDMAFEAIHKFRLDTGRYPILVTINRDMEPDLYHHCMDNPESTSYIPQITIHDNPRLFGIPVVWGDEFETL